LSNFLFLIFILITFFIGRLELEKVDGCKYSPDLKFGREAGVFLERLMFGKSYALIVEHEKEWLGGDEKIVGWSCLI
jgi:hypothetical protein